MHNPKSKILGCDSTDDQLANIFTKPLDEKRFYKLRNELNILDFLKYVLMHPHYMTCLSLEQSKVKLIDISFIHF